MKFGLTQSEFEYIVDTVVKPLEALGATVWCFGSRAIQKNNRYSDLDLLLEASPISSKLRAKVSQIQESLEEGNFAYKVDIVFEGDLAESYRTSVGKQKARFRWS